MPPSRRGVADKVVLRVAWRRYMQYRFVVTQMQKSAPGHEGTLTEIDGRAKMLLCTRSDFWILRTVYTYRIAYLL